jgi:hypothetical protein
MRPALAALVMSATAAPAADGPMWDREALTAAEWGVICAAPPVDRSLEPDTILGFIDQYPGEATVGLRTTRIPALPDLGFGVIARSRAPQGIDGVRVTVLHPPIAPAGTTRQSWHASIPPEAGAANFYRFDTAEELVPGRWRLTADLDGRVLYDVAFEVVDPALVPEFTDPCPGPAPIS